MEDWEVTVIPFFSFLPTIHDVMRPWQVWEGFSFDRASDKLLFFFNNYSNFGSTQVLG